MIVNTEGPMVVRAPNRTERHKNSNKDDDGFILSIIVSHWRECGKQLRALKAIFVRRPLEYFGYLKPYFTQ